MNNEFCLNCSADLNKSQRFCAKCGQATTTHRFTIASFFHEGFHAVTHADKGIFFLLKELTLRPGIVAREYIDGKRKKYFNPFTFFLLLMALFVFVNTFVSSKQQIATKNVPSRILNISDPKLKEIKMTEYSRGMVAKDFTTKHGNLIAMFAIPFFALFYWLIYFRRQYNYSEHLVANLMFVTFANLAFTLIVFPLQGVLAGTPWYGLITLIGFLLQAFYFTIAYKGLMQIKGFWAIARISLFSILGILLWVLFSVSVMAIYIVRNAHFYEYFRYMGS